MCELPKVTQPNTSKPRGSRRHKLWELAGRFHCSVIGSCLTLGELKRILKRCQITIEGDFYDYDLHWAFVSMTDTACTTTRQVQKCLDRKHAAEIRRFAKARSEAALAQVWDEKFGVGQIAGAYWALVTHPYVTDVLTTRAHGEVHMLSHQIGAANRADLKRLSALEQRCADLEAELSALKARTARQLHERDAALKKIKAR